MPTPVEILLKARSEAMALGLRYVYVGNVPGLPEVEDTFCPRCGKAVIRRQVFSVTERNLLAGKCMFCQTPIAGVWS
jgi:pyruvate formate lyase activating enzyme